MSRPIFFNQAAFLKVFDLAEVEALRQVFQRVGGAPAPAQSLPDVINNVTNVESEVADLRRPAVNERRLEQRIESVEGESSDLRAAVLELRRVYHRLEELEGSESSLSVLMSADKRLESRIQELEAQERDPLPLLEIKRLESRINQLEAENSDLRGEISYSRKLIKSVSAPAPVVRIVGGFNRSFNRSFSRRSVRPA